MLDCYCPLPNFLLRWLFSKNMSSRNTSMFSNSMDPDNAQHFSLNLASAVDKVYQQSNIWCSLSLIYIYIPDSLFLINSLICLNCRHKLFTYQCRLLITFANNLDPDQARRAWSGYKLLDTLLILPKKKNRKTKKKNTWFWKKNISRRQNHGKLPSRQKESMNWNGRCYMYMQVSCLSLIFACFQYGTFKDPCRLLQLRVCVRVCVKVMTSVVCGIDFRWISGYRYSCRLVYIIIAMQIYHVYL